MMKIAVFCVGSTLMLDDGLGPAVYEELSAYTFPATVDLFDVGCMSLDYLNAVKDYDLVITVDAIEGTGQPTGTIFRFTPEEMARRSFGSQSLHDLTLADLFDSALLVGYQAQGICLGMQVENCSPEIITEGLTPQVLEHLPLLVDCVLAELVNNGVEVVVTTTGEVVRSGFHHTLRAE